MKKKLDLNGIATVIARDTNGYISEDLRLALIQCSDAGLGDKPYEDTVPSEERKVNYGDEHNPMSLEADVILALRTKLGDAKAMEQLKRVNEGILVDNTNMLAARGTQSWEDCYSIVNLAYLLCVQHSLLYVENASGSRCYKTTYPKFFKRYIQDAAGKEECNSSEIKVLEYFRKTCNYVRMRQEKEMIKVHDVTPEMIEGWLRESGSYSRSISSAKKIYEELYGGKKIISLDDILAEEEGNSNEKRTSRMLYRGGAVSANPVEEDAINKQTEKEVATTMAELYAYAENDIEINAYVTYELNKDDMTYKSVMDLYGIDADEKEAKNLIQRGKRKLKKLVPVLRYSDEIREWLKSN